MTMQAERRFTAGNVELRAEGETGRVIGGHAAVFNKYSANLGGFIEEVDPAAFNKTLQESDVRCLWNHAPSDLLGRNVAGTLELETDNIGLAYRCQVPDTTTGRDVVILVGRGDVTQSSFGFRTISDDWYYNAEDFLVRRLLEVQLFDVSPVTYPAYLDADSTLVRAAYDRLAESRSLKLDEVIAAARAGDLRRLVPAQAGPPSDTETPDSTTAPSLRHRRLL